MPKYSRRQALCGALSVAFLPRAASAQVNAPQPGAALLQVAIEAFDKYRPLLRKAGVFGLVDFGIPSYYPRLFMISSGDHTIGRSFIVAHGYGLEDHRSPLSLVPKNFSNVPCSGASCIGALIGEDAYDGRHGSSLHIRGLDLTNDNARCRDIVIHSAKYVSGARARAKIPMGRSDGCFVVSAADRDTVIDYFKEGGFLYAGTSASTQTTSPMAKDPDLAGTALGDVRAEPVCKQCRQGGRG